MSEFDDQQTFRKALSLHQAGDLNSAKKLYHEIADKNPLDSYALHFLGALEATLGNHQQAKVYLERSLSIQPSNTQFLQNYATILFQMREYRYALEISKRGLQTNYADISLLYVSAISLCKLKRWDESIAQFDKLLSLAPDDIAAINERGSVLAAVKRYDAALVSFERVLRLQPRYAEAHLNTGNVLGVLRKYDAALSAYDKALELQPNLADAWLGRGNVLRGLKRYKDALVAYDRAFSIGTNPAGAWLGCGNIFNELKRYDEASAAFSQALALNPNLAEAWVGIGNQLNELKRSRDAGDAFDRALGLNPDIPEAWLGRGNAFLELKQYAAAFTAYDRAFALDANVKYAAGFRLLAKRHLCDWSNLETETALLLATIREGKPSSIPFVLLGAPSSAADQLQCARQFALDQSFFAPIWHTEVYAHERIRVAYLSSELRDHAVGYLAIGLFEHHDKSNFEVTAFSFETAQDSSFCQRMRAAFETFIDVHSKSDQEVAELIRQREIDIVVDLNGFTGNGRLGIFARKPAPVQVNYLGYAGSMGAEYYDYIVADATVIPQEDFEFYSEKVVSLPDSFLVNDHTRKIAEQTPSRDALNLPEKAFVFCCFNQLHKIDPTIFDVWMRLLREVTHGVLWLKGEDTAALNNLRMEAERRGVDPQRLVFAQYVPLIADHLGRHQRADLFLDTLHYNAHTTTNDALWAGLPVVTYLGSTFAGRVSASQLKALGLGELITTSLSDYESLALRLARDSSLLASIKAKLAFNRISYPLFDTERSTRHIEAAYTTMWERYQRGEKPQAFAVEPICSKI